MSDHDNDRLLQMQRDGVRTVSGHHMPTHDADNAMCMECYGVERHAPRCPTRLEGEDGEGNRDWLLDR